VVAKAAADKDRGFVLLERSIQDSRAWTCSKCYKLLTWLIMNAAHTGHWFPPPVRNAKPVWLKRGQCWYGRNSVAEQLKDVSPQELETRMAWLAAWGTITTNSRSNSQGSIVTIVEYELYQHKARRSQQQKQQQPTSNAQARKNGNNGNNGKTCGHAPAPRKSNPVWDAVCAEWGLSPDTKNDASRIGWLARDFGQKIQKGWLDHPKTRVLSEATIIGAKRAGIKKLSWWKPGSDTPESVLKHWDEIDGQPSRAPDPGQPGHQTQLRYEREVLASLEAGRGKLQPAERAAMIDRKKAEIAKLETQTARPGGPTEKGESLPEPTGAGE